MVLFCHGPFHPSYCFLTDVPTKEGVGVYVWSAAIVLCSVVTKERDAEVKPLVCGNKGTVRLNETCWIFDHGGGGIGLT